MTGGEARGARIPSGHRGKARPTPSIVREALFNILGSIEGSSWLDLYAGTGSVGLEALSRGAGKVIFVEKNTSLARQVSRVIGKMGYEERAKVVAGDVISFLHRLVRAEELFDVVFADPPYESELARKTMESCLKSPVLNVGGLLIIQHSRHESLDIATVDAMWQVVDVRRYGDTILTIIQYHKRSVGER